MNCKKKNIFDETYEYVTRCFDYNENILSESMHEWIINMCVQIYTCICKMFFIYLIHINDDSCPESILNKLDQKFNQNFRVYILWM